MNEFQDKGQKSGWIMVTYMDVWIGVHNKLDLLSQGFHSGLKVASFDIHTIDRSLDLQMKREEEIAYNDLVQSKNELVECKLLRPITREPSG